MGTIFATMHSKKIVVPIPDTKKVSNLHSFTSKGD